MPTVSITGYPSLPWPLVHWNPESRWYHLPESGLSWGPICTEVVRDWGLLVLNTSYLTITVTARTLFLDEKLRPIGHDH